MRELERERCGYTMVWLYINVFSKPKHSPRFKRFLYCLLAIMEYTFVFIAAH